MSSEHCRERSPRLPRDAAGRGPVSRQHGGLQVGGLPAAKQTHPSGQSSLPLKHSMVVGWGMARTQRWNGVPAHPALQEQQSSRLLQGQALSSPKLQVSEFPLMKQPLLQHASPLAHEPHVSVPPQPSENEPHCFAWHVAGVQQLPWLQTCPAAHVVTQVPVASQVRHSPVGQSPHFEGAETAIRDGAAASFARPRSTAAADAKADLAGGAACCRRCRSYPGH